MVVITFSFENVAHIIRLSW